ncbi:MAG: hypothetical protein ACREKI_02235, partial [Gemmatimonadota bacterium]
MRTPNHPLGVTLGLLATLAFSDGRAQSEGTSLAGAIATITAEDVRARVGLLAHDSMRGRDTPSPELEETAQYVAGQFRAFGLEPGAGDGYIQRYPILVRRTGGGSRIEVPGGSAPRALTAGEGFALYAGSGVP